MKDFVNLPARQPYIRTEQSALSFSQLAQSETTASAVAEKITPVLTLNASGGDTHQYQNFQHFSSAKQFSARRKTTFRKKTGNLRAKSRTRPNAQAHAAAANAYGHRTHTTNHRAVLLDIKL